MASSERVHKLSVEAFSRLKNDHEQFLEAYEKPTQIYRFLHARHSLKPLFMHRNLAYMQHRNTHRRKKRTNKIRVNDFLKYRKECEPKDKDLASQIKSDNFLEITFHDLEKGVDFSHLLSAALSGDVRQAPPTCHAPSLMELEVLLYQHTSEAASCLCSSVSLGKFEVEYTPSKNAKIVGCRDSNHTLMIPESKLVWNGKNRGIGSLMLVFRARASTGQKSHQKKSLQPSLAKVSVELNRMNQSDIAQLTKTKHSLQIASQANTATFEGSPRVPKYTQSATDFDSQQATVFSNSMNGSSSGVEAYDSNLEKGNANSNTVSSNSEMPRNTTAKVKEKRDACIMTDLSLGTGEATSPSHEHNACNGPLEHDLGVSRNDRSCSESPFFPKKGFTEDSASLLGKLASQRNGFLNGLNLFNGLTDDHQSQKANDHSISHNEEGAAFPDSNESNYSLTVSIPCTYRNGSQASSTSSLFIESSNHRKGYKIPARKRSEIQLLLDGDKPPGQRISPEEIPVFTAEDPSNRATRYMALQSKGCWTQLGTGTRKTTPVEPFTYSVSPTLIPNKMSGIKRSLSESDAPFSSDISSPPPKMARVSETDEQPEESMDETLGGQNSDIGPMRAFSKSVSPPPSPTPPLLPPSPPPNFENELDDKIHESSEQAPQSIAPEGLFCAEMVVFDSRGECLLDKGEYSILMQKCSQKEAGSEPPPLVTFSPLSWSSVFGGGEQNEAEQSESIMLKFSLSWSQGPPKHRLHTELETALDLQRIRNDYFPPIPRPPITNPSSGNTACTTTASGSVPSPPPDRSEQSNPPANPLTSNSSPAVVSSQQEYACNGEETGDREDDLEEMMLENETEEKETSPQLKDTPSTHQDNGVKASKDDHVEEYFTATEASASSVADSTELTQCRPPSIPLFAPSFEKAGRIIYNFLYHNNSLQQTESRGDLRCPWCSLLCGNLYSLLKHMSLCHPRFLFTYTPMEGGSVIDVHVNKLYEAGQTSMDRDPVERSGMNLRQRWKVPLKCLPCTAIIVERHEAVVEDLSEFLNDGSWKRGYNVKRQYYHSHTCLPMVPEEIDQDSEVELESIGRWQKICSQKMIDEFTDVNKGEKEMMKMWNLFAMKQGMTAYKQIPGACLQFTQEKGSEIIQKKIVYSFLAHLIGLSDFGLITPSVIKSCMDTLHSLQAS